MLRVRLDPLVLGDLAAETGLPLEVRDVDSSPGDSMVELMVEVLMPSRTKVQFYTRVREDTAVIPPPNAPLDPDD